MTRSVGIIGYPLKHTLSPVLQQAAFDYYELDVRYEVWETEPGQLPSAVSRLRSPENIGANVTVPYKESVVGLLDGLDSTAATIGAANTIVKRDGRLIGHNTDVQGFVRSLREDALFHPEGRRAVVLGAGGAARAVCFGLLEMGVASMVIANRTAGRALELVEALSRWRLKLSVGTELVAVEWGSKEMLEYVLRSHLIVNCTVMGMAHGPVEGQSPLSAEEIPADTLVYDLVYNPLETPLLKAAAQAGARRMDGLRMLVYQGAASFELWTGKVAPVGVMMAAARKALERRG
ncbi:MAG: shikimate dehydrogenase [Dehalococcoidia bacterium]|nr:shikimate dehydrogenase [Dehalococcoidia bacterium]